MLLIIRCSYSNSSFGKRFPFTSRRREIVSAFQNFKNFVGWYPEVCTKLHPFNSIKSPLRCKNAMCGMLELSYTYFHMTKVSLSQMFAM